VKACWKVFSMGDTSFCEQWWPPRDVESVGWGGDFTADFDKNVVLTGVWVGPVGVVASILVPRIAGWSGEHNTHFRTCTARLLRLVADTCSQVGVFGPVVGIFHEMKQKDGVASGGDRAETNGDETQNNGALYRWAQDQEWHRGDFIIYERIVSGEEYNLASTADRLLAPVSTEALRVDRIANYRDMNDTLECLERLVRQSRSSARAELEDLTSRVVAGVRSNNLSDTLNDWVETIRQATEEEAALVIKGDTHPEDAEG
jgi:hypothetical protein